MWPRFTLLFLLFFVITFAACSKKADKKLLDFAKLSDIAGVVSSINSGANVNARDDFGWTPVMVAAENGSETILRILLKNGGNVNVRNKYDWTPLMYAARNNHYSIVKLLLKNGAETSLVNSEGWTALMWAAAKGYKDILLELLNNGSDYTIKDFRGQTAFSHSRVNAHFEIAEILLSRGAKIIDADNAFGAFLLAERRGFMKLTPSKLKKAPGKVFVTRAAMLRAALLSSAEYGKVHDIKQLLLRGVNINCVDENGHTPLMLAIINEKVHAVAFLLANGADVDMEDKYGIKTIDIPRRYGVYDPNKYIKAINDSLIKD